MAEGGYTKHELKQISINVCKQHLTHIPEDCLECWFKEIDDPMVHQRYYKCKITDKSVHGGYCKPHCTPFDFTKFLMEIL